MSNTLFDTRNYEVVTKEIYNKETSEYELGYSVKNKTTEVYEYDTFLLPEAILWAKKLNEDVDDLLAEEITEEVIN